MADETYSIYWGTESGDLSLIASGTESLSVSVPIVSLDYVTTYYWRVDATNENGTTTGDEWSFTTLRFSPPTTVYWDSTVGYYQLLVQSDGTFGDPPPGGTENTDYVVVDGPNDLSPVRKMVVVSKNGLYFED